MATPQVLVVDDHPETLELLQVVLTLGGLEVTSATGGRPALEADLGRFDAVVTDLAMPGLDGFELIRLLRNRMPRPVPIVVLTGQGTPEDRMPQCRCCLVLRKPCLPDALTGAVRRLLVSCIHDCDNCANRRARTLDARQSAAAGFV